MKVTKLAFFINGDTPPELGFDIDWYDVYSDAVNSTSEISGYFKPNNQGGKSNIMILSNNPLPINELDISNLDAFSMVHNTTPELRISDTNINDVRGSQLSYLAASNTQLKRIPSMLDNATIKVDGNNLSQAEVDAITNSFLIYSDDEVPVPVSARPNMTLENDGNATADTNSITLIEGDGGAVYEADKEYLSFQTDASVATGFQMHVSAGADVNWYEDGVLVASSTNNTTMFFTDSSIKTIRIGGEDVQNASYILLGSKSLTGTCDLSAMTNSEYRFDFNTNPNLTAVELPRTDGIFDQLLGYGTGITTLRLDKTPGLVNAQSCQIRLNDCPNLDTDSIARNILAVDTAAVTGRILFLSGSPALDSSLNSQLVANGWTIA